MRKHHHIFSSLIKRAADFGAIPTAVAYPLSEVALRGASEAAHQGLIRPILVGPVPEIDDLAKKSGIDIAGFARIAAETEEEAARVAVEVCRTGKAEALMKGSLHTDHLMHAVMQDGIGLRATRRLSHVFIGSFPTIRACC